MEHTYNPSTREAEAGDYHNLETNMGYTASLPQKQNTRADMVAPCVMSHFRGGRDRSTANLRAEQLPSQTLTQNTSQLPIKESKKKKL